MGILNKSNNCCCTSSSSSQKCTTDNNSTPSNVGIGSNSSTTCDSGYCCNITPDTIEKAAEPAPAPKPVTQCESTPDSGVCNASCQAAAAAKEADRRRRVLGR